jgi:hypothetical protein
LDERGKPHVVVGRQEVHEGATGVLHVGAERSVSGRRLLVGFAAWAIACAGTAFALHRTVLREDGGTCVVIGVTIFFGLLAWVVLLTGRLWHRW